MRRFRFSLQKLLDFRRRQEDEKKADLARVQGRINRQQGLINDLKDRRKRMAGPRPDAPAVLSARETALRSMLFIGIDGRITSARKKVEGLQPELQQATGAYMEARRNRRVIERLREKKEAEFKQEERRRENRQLSEISEQQYIRRRD